jgi:hypothetical protein
VSRVLCLILIAAIFFTPPLLAGNEAALSPLHLDNQEEAVFKLAELKRAKRRKQFGYPLVIRILDDLETALRNQIPDYANHENEYEDALLAMGTALSTRRSELVGSPVTLESHAKVIGAIASQLAELKEAEDKLNTQEVETYRGTYSFEWERIQKEKAKLQKELQDASLTLTILMAEARDKEADKIFNKSWNAGYVLTPATLAGFGYLLFYIMENVRGDYGFPLAYLSMLGTAIGSVIVSGIKDNITSKKTQALYKENIFDPFSNLMGKKRLRESLQKSLNNNEQLVSSITQYISSVPCESIKSEVKLRIAPESSSPTKFRIAIEPAIDGAVLEKAEEEAVSEAVKASKPALKNH